LTAYLNGEYLALEDARISVLDRGFLFGDGVYEVIPVYRGVLFRLEAHLDRLGRSLSAIRIDNPYPRDQWRRLLDGLVARGQGDPLSVYLQITRGVARRDHAFPGDTPPTVFAMVNPMSPPAETVLARGVDAVLREDLRWQRCDIKAIALLANVLMRQSAVDEDATEAILIRDGYLTEGAASNVLIVDRGVIVTPPNGPLLLPGVTRDLVLELAREAGLEAREEPISESRLRAADEVWLTSSTKEIVAVTRLDGDAIGDGSPGPLWRRVHALFQDYKRALGAGLASSA
jgi:D-alanine transaminase